MPRSKWFLLVLILGAALSGCVAGVERISPVQTEADRKQVQERIDPTVRQVPDVDVDLLWKAALDFMRRFVRGDSNLDLVDQRRRVIETRTLEWIEDSLPHRTRITVEIARDVTDPRGVRLGVVALLIEPVLDVRGAVTGRPLPNSWTLAGNNPEVEKVIADEILRRYLLLRQGRDPDTVPIPLETLPPNLRRAE